MIKETHILLSRDLESVLSLQQYISDGGLVGLQKARSLSLRAVIEEVKSSGLRGRGGAGFPTGIKWSTVYEAPCATKYVVCNGSEGEPGTYKDRYLIGKNPYQLIEGLMIAAYAVEAKGVFIGLKAKFKKEIARVEKAIDEMVETDVMPPGYIRVVRGPDEYLFGEEKALLEVIDGRGAMPRNIPPFIQGVRFTPLSSNPTIVNNVETMSHLPHILAKGADWFKSIGSSDTPGTMIFTLSGDIKCPGMYELPLGMTIGELLYDVGKGPRGAHPFQAVFSGVANRVITPDMFDTTLAFGTMRSAGTGLGSAGFIVYDEDVCMVKMTAQFSIFLAIASCGQCLPCNRGTRIVTQYLDRFENGLGTEEDLDKILMECRRMTSQTRCYLPMEESVLITSIINKFRKEFISHIGRPCSYQREVEFPLINSYDEQTRQFTFASEVQCCC